MIRTSLWALLLLGIALPARAERLWLVVGASDASAATLARRAEALGTQFPQGLVVQTRDCGDKKNVLAWVAQAAPSAEEAQAVLARLKATVGSAYLKPCEVAPQSLLALRVTAIDPSIAKVPRDAVNWDDQDRVSSANPLPDGRTLVIARYFSSEDESPLEGRNARVLLAGLPGQRLRTLEASCIDAGQAAASAQGRLAFQCAREQAAEAALHAVPVFDSSGERLQEIERCRDPAWSGERVIVCKEESVDMNGQLGLRKKRVELGR